MHLKPNNSMDEYLVDRSPQPQSPNSNLRYSVTNENWRGKNDPAERRRIQNRLNQRAFRERQRAGEPTKQYKSRSLSGGSSSRLCETQTPPEDEQECEAGAHEDQSLATPTTLNQTSRMADTSTGRYWDELGRLINRNFMQAANSNAQHLHISSGALQTGAPVLAPQTSHIGTPTALHTVKLQHEMVHDPIIDTIPHARLRFNILRAIATRQLDPAAFSISLRASGALENVNEQWHRGGLVVWDVPEQLSSWELSEAFVQRWPFLLQGCDDLLAATNFWRRKRGERSFPVSPSA